MGTPLHAPKVTSHPPMRGEPILSSAQWPVLLYKVNTLTCRNRSRKDRDDLSIDLLLSN